MERAAVPVPGGIPTLGHTPQQVPAVCVTAAAYNLPCAGFGGLYGGTQDISHPVMGQGILYIVIRHRGQVVLVVIEHKENKAQKEGKRSLCPQGIKDSNFATLGASLFT